MRTIVYEGTIDRIRLDKSGLFFRGKARDVEDDLADALLKRPGFREINKVKSKSRHKED